MGKSKWVAVVALLVATGACTGSDKPEGAAIADAKELADVLAASTLGCDARTEFDPLGDRPEDGVHDPLPSALQCSTSTGPAVLLVYDDADDRAAALANGEVSVAELCAGGRGMVGSVVADNWRVVVGNDESAAAVSEALDQGASELVPCLAEE